MTLRIFSTRKGDRIRRSIAAVLASTGVVALAAGSLIGMTATSANAVTADYATVTGYQAFSSDANHADYWGDNCTKIDSENLGNSYVLPAGTYTKVIVKAASKNVGDHSNTIFAAPPTAGQTVWADTNGDGVYNPGGKGGDKAISHIIFCTGQSSSSSSSSSSESSSSSSSSESSSSSSSSESSSSSSSIESSSSSSIESSSSSSIESSSSSSSESSESSSSSDSTSVLPTNVVKTPKVLPTSVDAGLSVAPASGSSGTGLIVAGFVMIFAAASILLGGRRRGTRQV